MTLRNRLELTFALCGLVLGGFNISGSIPKIQPVPNSIPEAWSRIDAISRATGIPRDRVKITEWHPDTCSCIVQYAWDRNTTELNRVHYPVRVIACPYHALHGIPGRKMDWSDGSGNRTYIEDILNTVWAENQQKNVAVGELSKRLGVSPDTVKWSFDSNRILSVFMGPQVEVARVK